MAPQEIHLPAYSLRVLLAGLVLRKIYESLTQLATESRKKCFQKEGSLLSDIRRMGRLDLCYEVA